MELLAACGWDAQAYGPGPLSFTRALVDALKAFCPGGRFTTSQLYSKLVSLMKEKGCNIMPTPTHIPLIGERKNVIELAALAKDSSISASSDPTSQSSSQYSGHTQNPSSKVSSTTDASSIDAGELMDPPSPTNPHVLLSIALEKDQNLDKEEWIDWYRRIPAKIVGAKFQGVFRSDSTLLLVSMPISVWDGLKDNPAYSFINFIKSGNLLLNLSDCQEPLSLSSTVGLSGSSHNSSLEDTWHEDKRVAGAKHPKESISRDDCKASFSPGTKNFAIEGTMSSHDLKQACSQEASAIQRPSAAPKLTRKLPIANRLDPLDVLRDKLRRGRTSPYDGQRTSFIPRDHCARTISRKVILECVKDAAVDTPLLDTPTEAADRIYVHALIMFAIFVYTRHPLHDLYRLLENNIGDGDLPLQPQLIKDRLENTIQYDDLLDAQWIFLAPVFSYYGEHQSFPPDVILPFISKGKIGMGGFSKIYRVTIHAAHVWDPSLRKVGRKLLHPIFDLIY